MCVWLCTASYIQLHRYVASEWSSGIPACYFQTLFSESILLTWEKLLEKVTLSGIIRRGKSVMWLSGGGMLSQTKMTAWITACRKGRVSPSQGTTDLSASEADRRWEPTTQMGRHCKVFTTLPSPGTSGQCLTNPPTPDVSRDRRKKITLQIGHYN